MRFFEVPAVVIPKSATFQIKRKESYPRITAQITKRNRAGDTVRGLEVPVDDPPFVYLSKAGRYLLHDVPYHY
jgi:hypothetical protein